MDNHLQEIIDRGMTFHEITLPIGEFEGPFYVRKPCTIVGNSTTLWAKNGPALVVESTGVTVRHLRVEVLEAEVDAPEYVSVMTQQRDTCFEQVEVIGAIKGVAGEEKLWHIPKLLSLGEFSPSGASFIIEVEVPVAVDLYTSISALILTPKHLQPGRHKVVLTIEPCKQGTFFYGEIAIVSQFVQKVYLNGLASEQSDALEGSAVVLYTPEQGTCKRDILNQGLLLNQSLSSKRVEVLVDDVLPINEQKALAPMSVIVPMPSDGTLLRKGERIAVCEHLSREMVLTMTYTERNEQLDIDPYVFLLDEHSKAHGDEDLIFFGNPKSRCGAVAFQEEGSRKTMILRLQQLPSNIERVALSFGIYGDRAENNFSKLQEAAVQILADGKEEMRLPLTELSIERTLVAIEFYRYKGQWKLNAIGSGYREGLKRLCESYGLEIADA